MAKKILNGTELAGFIKQRQAKQVRMLRQAHGIAPKLVIIQSESASDVIASYVRMKQRYANDVLIDVDVQTMAEDMMADAVKRANEDAAVHGVIVQLPLKDVGASEEIVNMIAPQKDVDGLGKDAHYISATAEAIDWLLSGYGVELPQKRIALVGHGKLVGRPLEALWSGRGYDVTVVTRTTDNQLDEVLQASDVIVSATGTPRLIHDGNTPHGAVVVDAGTVSEDGQIVGDTAPELQVRRDLTITPQKGGVGPLTIVLLFDHVIQSALEKIPKN